MAIKVIETPLAGVAVIEPKVFGDARGYFMETWSGRDFEAAAQGVTFVQDNESSSVRGVMRGLHFQRPPYTQAKLVRCVRGRVLDVVVDLRLGSPTYLQHLSVELSGDNRRQLFIPRGMAHGFAVLSDTAVFQYKCDNYYAPEADGGISLLDPSLGIEWPFSPAEAILSPKDVALPGLDEFDNPFTPEALEACIKY